MKRTIKFTLLVVVALLLLPGCYTSSRVISDGCNQTLVSNSWVNAVTEAAQKPTVSEQLSVFERLAGSRNCLNEPVLLNLYGLSLLRAGQHQLGYEQLSKAVNLVNEGSLRATTADVESIRLRHTYNYSGNTNQSNEATILAAFRELFEAKNNGRNTSNIELKLVDALMERPGFTPYPPYFAESGTPGIILETLNEIAPDHFRPEIAWYIQPNQNRSMARNQNAAAIRSNMILAGILNQDQAMIDEALSAIENESITRLEVRSKIALGLYIRQQNPDQFTTTTTRNLFR